MNWFPDRQRTNGDYQYGAWNYSDCYNSAFGSVADYDKPKMRGKYSYGNILRKYEKGKRMIFDAI